VPLWVELDRGHASAWMQRVCATVFAANTYSDRFLFEISEQIASLKLAARASALLAGCVGVHEPLRLRWPASSSARPRTELIGLEESNINVQAFLKLYGSTTQRDLIAL